MLTPECPAAIIVSPLHFYSTGNVLSLSYEWSLLPLQNDQSPHKNKNQKTLSRETCLAKRELANVRKNLGSTSVGHLIWSYL